LDSLKANPMRANLVVFLCWRLHTTSSWKHFHWSLAGRHPQSRFLLWLKHTIEPYSRLWKSVCKQYIYEWSTVLHGVEKSKVFEIILE
jgi:hypothetical protein